MTPSLPDLPRFLVLNPVSTVRIEMRLETSACEIDVELDNPKPGRSFVLLIGRAGGPYVQRVRLAGRARIYFDPEAPGAYELLLANPQRDPVVLRLRGRDVGRPVARVGKRRAKPIAGRRSPSTDPAPARRHRTPRRRSRVGRPD
ncbi:MAG: hypothetical protein ACRECT_08485 [Thermoplasmata archaeon]